MRKFLTIEIDCGETTCASKPGVFCRFLSTTKFGQRTHCHLFESAVYEHDEGLLLGWLKRLPQCLLAEEDTCKLQEKKVEQEREAIRVLLGKRADEWLALSDEWRILYGWDAYREALAFYDRLIEIIGEIDTEVHRVKESAIQEGVKT